MLGQDYRASLLGLWFGFLVWSKFILKISYSSVEYGEVGYFLEF